MSKNYLKLILFLLPFSSLAQAILSGSVSDEAGLALPGATISIGGKASISDAKGRFAINDLTAGESDITITYIGYSPVSQKVSLQDGVNSQSFRMETGVTFKDEVVVLGDRLKGQAKALNQQKTNANITNVVSADQIGRFPDANIGDALKRIPGITMQNDQGEARNIIIRGMAPQLNSVTLNGERIPSAEGDNRMVQMDLIPSDMIQTIQVNKAVLPDMDADAIGGSVNLVTRKAPADLRVSTTLGSGINMLSKKPIYNGAIVIGNRIWNDKFGFVISGSYNNHNFGSDNVEAVWIESDAGDVIDELDIREYKVQRVRRSLSANLDYDFSPNHSIGFSAMYNWRDDWENRFRMTVSQLEDAFEDGEYSISNDIISIPAGRVQYQTKGGIDNARSKNRRLEDQRVWNYTVNGSHLFNKLKATWNITAAKASEERPNERYISFREKDQAITVNLQDPYFPFANLTNPGDNLNIEFNELTEQYQYTYDQDLNARLDLQLPYSDKGLVKFGGRFRDKIKDRDLNFFSYESVSDAFPKLNDTETANYSDENFLAGSQYQVGIFPTAEFLGKLDLENSALFKKGSVPEEFVPGEYKANETITAAYAMMDQQLTSKLALIAGIRYEHTHIDYTGNIYNIDDESTSEDSRTNYYGNFLPGIHLKYDGNDNTVVRLAWTNTIARPNYYDLVPYAAFSPQDAELERGNPDLLPTLSSNFDLMGEKYFENVGIFSLGAFYKDITNFIYSQTLQNYNDPQFGNDLEYSLPRNGGTAQVFGVETALQRQIWKGLGIYLNYTFTQSSTTGIEEREDEDLALPGTAKHMFNASLSYEDKKFVARASLNYASDYLDELGGDSFEDRFYDEQLFLDVNASYALTPSLRLYLEGNNLTNQPLRYYQGARQRTAQVEFYNARFNFGLKFDLNK